MPSSRRDRFVLVAVHPDVGFLDLCPYGPGDPEDSQAYDGIVYSVGTVVPSG